MNDNKCKSSRGITWWNRIIGGVKLTCAIFMMTMLVLNLSGCGGGETDEEAEPVDNEKVEMDRSAGENDEKCVVCIYMCGSDLESGVGAATADLEELTSVSLPEDVKVVIETGGSKVWMNDTISENCNTRLEYSNDQLSILEENEASNMGEADTLASFMEFCRDNYEADNRVLIFWNHGGGSVGGVAYDETFDYDSLSLAEIQLAMDTVYPEKQQEFNIIGFDACLMANVETASVIKEHAKYMVASEESEPGNGWEYSGLFTGLSADPAMDGANLGKIICDTFYEGCKKEDTDKAVTLSVVDLNKIDAVIESIDEVGNEIIDKTIEDESTCCEFARCAYDSENYGGNNDEQGYANMVDLGHLVENAGDMLPATKDMALAAIDDAVVYQVNGKYRKHAHGLSIYYSYSCDTQEMSDYEQFSVSDLYTGYLEYSLGMDIGAEPEEAESYEELLPVEGFDTETYEEQSPFDCAIDDGYISLKVDESAIDSIAAIRFYLYYLDTETNDMLCLGTDNDITCDWETGEFKDNFRGVWGSIDGNLCCMRLYYEGDDYNLYAVPAIVNNENKNIIVAYDIESDYFDIIGVCGEITEDCMMGQKDMAPLFPGDEITLQIEALSLQEGSEGEESTYEYDPFEYSEDSKFEEIELFEGSYGYVLELEDTLGATVESDMMFINYEDGNITVEE